jgi:hypothetical protein
MAERTEADWLANLADPTRQAIEYFSMRFESEWQAGRRPRLEGYLAALKDPAGRPGLLAELLPIELNYRRRAGEQPVPKEYADRFSEHAAVGQVRSVRAPELLAWCRFHAATAQVLPQQAGSIPLVTRPSRVG